MKLLTLFLIATAGLAQMLTPAVKTLAQSGDFASARAVLSRYQKERGVTAEYLEAYSWIGRAQLAAKQYREAETTATEVRERSLNMLKKRPLDADTALPTALGASIEVRAQAAAAQGRRDEAVTFLRAEGTRWRATSIRARINKNLNLLNLEGKPAPAMQTGVSLSSVKARPLAAHAGRPLLLFFWAHWCSDCKAQVGIIERLRKTYPTLDVVAPTQHYGYAAGGEEAPRAIETKYIAAIQHQYYGGLNSVEIPLSEENFGSYGVSTTPTLVLTDSAGIVRMYHPGAMTYDQLAARIEPLVTKR